MSPATYKTRLLIQQFENSEIIIWETLNSSSFSLVESVWITKKHEKKKSGSLKTWTGAEKRLNLLNQLNLLSRAALTLETANSMF